MTLKRFKNYNKIEAGVDEVGRGCLLGRVYASSVIMPQTFRDDIYKQIKDSKKLSEKKRNYLADYIKDIALDWGISYCEADTIDEINIFNSSHMAMHKSLDKLNINLDNILVDGKYFKEYSDKKDDYINYECITNGDNIYLSIAAASILAKVERDNYIKDLVKNNNYLEKYDLLNNKGYGTKKHLEAINNYGISPFHRLTFGICKRYKK